MTTPRAAAAFLCLVVGVAGLCLLEDWRGRAGFGALRDSPNGAPFSTELVGKHASLGPQACALCHHGGTMAAPGSSVCLSCHDGALAPAGTTSRRSQEAFDPTASHPVGADYLQAWALRPGEYNDPHGHPGIRLDEGRVGCVSCHRLHGPAQPGSRPTVIENACEACHRR